MSSARYLIDTSVLVRLLLKNGEQYGWDRAAEAGLIALCSAVELESLRSVRSWADRQRLEEVYLGLFGWVPTDDRMFSRAAKVQAELTRRGHHRSARTVDLLVAATAELHDLTLLHRDNDFECIAAVTGQPLEWFGPARGADS